MCRSIKSSYFIGFSLHCHAACTSDHGVVFYALYDFMRIFIFSASKRFYGCFTWNHCVIFSTRIMNVFSFYDGSNVMTIFTFQQVGGVINDSTFYHDVVFDASWPCYTCYFHFTMVWYFQPYGDVISMFCHYTTMQFVMPTGHAWLNIWPRCGIFRRLAMLCMFFTFYHGVVFSARWRCYRCVLTFNHGVLYFSTAGIAMQD